MKVLITGGTGFVAPHLKELLSKDNEVITSSRSSKEHLKLDLCDYGSSRRVLIENKFEKIFHLGLQSSVHVSFEHPFDTMRENITSTMNLLKIAKELDCKVIFAGTSEVYKSKHFALTKDTDISFDSDYALRFTLSLTEESDIDCSSPYALSKLTIDKFVKMLAERLKLKIAILRLFNHTGPGQSNKFALSNFACQLAKISLKLQEPVIKVGNLDVFRDFSDVRDVVRAYSMVSNDVLYGDIFNVCSGTSYKLRGLLDRLITISGVDVEIKTDENLLRRKDVEFYCGNANKIKQRFGWVPEIKIEKTLGDLYKWWLSKLQEIK